MLRVSPAPHVRAKEDVKSIMWWVVIALVPSMVASFIFFGFRAIFLTAVGVAFAVLTEYLSVKLFKMKNTVNDGSAVITGILLAFNVSPNVPWWMVAVGSVFAIFIGKMVFGGLGYNPVNPALAGRAFLMASWPVQMTSMWKVPNLKDATLSGITTIGKASDVITSATPLNVYKYHMPDIIALKSSLLNLFLGNVGGVIGETSALALLIGGLFLIYKKIISYRIPFFYIGTVFILSWIFNKTGTGLTANFWIEPTFHILAGGLFLGAFFMATDMVTSPITAKGQIIFAISLGLLTFLIRRFGGYPEGVSYSILLMNLVVPIINKTTMKKVFGKRGVK